MYIIGKSTVIVNREPVPSIDVFVQDRIFRVWQSFQEWDFTIGQFVAREPSICAFIIDGGCLPPYEKWEEIKNEIRPIFMEKQ